MKPDEKLEPRVIYIDTPATQLVCSQCIQPISQLSNNHETIYIEPNTKEYVRARPQEQSEHKISSTSTSVFLKQTPNLPTLEDHRIVHQNGNCAHKYVKEGVRYIPFNTSACSSEEHTPNSQPNHLSIPPPHLSISPIPRTPIPKVLKPTSHLNFELLPDEAKKWTHQPTSPAPPIHPSTS